MKTYHIYTIGCQMNKADSERIAAYLENFGLNEADSMESADLVILTTCGVRQSAEDRVYGLVKKIKQENPEAALILTGCLSERLDVIKRVGDRVDLWLPIAQLPHLAFKLGLGADKDMLNYLSIKPKHQSGVSAFVPIGNGCNNYCSYCVVPYARHREVYRPHQEILSEVKELVALGFKEITLIAQNVNSYQDAGLNFPQLLKACADLAGDFWLRFATSHPKDMSADLIAVMAANDKFCNYIHLPAQAGNNEVLKAMNRKYTVEHYLDLIKKIRKAMPEVGLTTDIIVGFPGESREQFQDTVELFRQARYDMAYIAQYSPRPGTAAFELEDNVTREEKKWREEELMKVLRQTALENGQKYLGQTVKVLVEGQNKKGEWFGKTQHFKNVKIKKEAKLLSGGFVEVEVAAVADFGWKGKLK